MCVIYLYTIYIYTIVILLYFMGNQFGSAFWQIIRVGCFYVKAEQVLNSKFHCYDFQILNKPHKSFLKIALLFNMLIYLGLVAFPYTSKYDYMNYELVTVHFSYI